MQNEQRIAETVKTALSYSGQGQDRLVRLLEFVTKLESDPDWSAADIMVVQTRAYYILYPKNAPDGA